MGTNVMTHRIGSKYKQSTSLSGDNWCEITIAAANPALGMSLFVQQSAGTLQYHLQLATRDSTRLLRRYTPAETRSKGDMPCYRTIEDLLALGLAAL